jgi:Zn-dependent metalloprotease
MGSLDYWVNRNTFNQRSSSIYRIIIGFDINEYPGEVLREEGQPPLTDIKYSDSFNRLYDNLGIAYGYFKKVHKRNSLDDKGCVMVGVGNTKTDYAASWNPSIKALEIRFEPVSYPGCTGIDTSYFLDAVGHELTHGINDYSEDVLSAKSNPTAAEIGIREHLADCFSLLIQAWNSGTVFWGTGRGVCRERIDLPIHSFDDQPALSNTAKTMDEFVERLGKDTGSAYYPELMAGYFNTTILGYAFYIFSTFVGGEPYDIPSKVWYKILASTNTEKDFVYSTSFQAFANASLFYCEQLYPEHLNKLKYAWYKVKVLDLFKEDRCKLMILEMEYKAAHEQYWLDLGIKEFNNA